jgi:hypothetical protein
MGYGILSPMRLSESIEQLESVPLDAVSLVTDGIGVKILSYRGSFKI